MIIVGKDGKTYETVKECMKADELFDKKLAEKEAEERELQEKLNQEKAAITKRKKELSEAIEKAEEDYVASCNLYDIANKQASDIMHKSNEEAKKILAEAKKKADEIREGAETKANEILVAASRNIEKASEKKMQAISEFNKEFGEYRTTLSGPKAIEAHNRLLNDIQRVFNRFFKF